MEQWTGSKLGKEYIKAVYCHPAYLYTEYIMRNAGLEEAQAGIKIAGRNAITSDIQITGEGNDNPLQYSCLENPMDREAWWATVHGVRHDRVTSLSLSLCI